MIYPCGCEFIPDDRTGAMHRKKRCPGHQKAYRDPSKLEAGYYSELASLDAANMLANSCRVTEMVDAIGPFPQPSGVVRCLEIGCGTSSYVGTLRMAGWQYVGMDISGWAVHWNSVYWTAHGIHADWEQWSARWNFGLILCAHALEHMKDAPIAVKQMCDYLDHGGHTIILVPDDRDPVNPDHLWNFTDETLRRTIEFAGLEVLKLERRSVVEREDFLYAIARRP